MEDSTACTKRLLARVDIGAVEQCSCGAAHVTIGAVTLRLCPEAVEHLAVLFQRAAAALDVHAALPPGAMLQRARGSN